MFVETRLDRGRLDHKKPPTVHLMTSIKAPEIAEEKRKPIDIVIVLDVSSSMTDAATTAKGSPSKLVLAKQAARKFVEQLQSGDRVGVVIYSTTAEVLAPLAELTDKYRAEVVGKLANITHRNSTDLVAGTLRGLDMMKECPADGNRTRRIILFTDGLPTSGITQHAEVMRAITGQLDGQTPITTMGFGAIIVANGAGSGGYDPELLTSIARASGGNFYHAEGADGILSAFALELGALRSVALTGVKVIITPGTDIAVKEVMNDFTVTSNGRETTVEIGNLYGGETQHIVAVLHVPVRDQVFPRDTLMANVKVIGVESSGSTVVETRDAHFRYVRADEADKEPDLAVEEARQQLAAAKELELAFKEAEAGNYAAAARRMEGVRDQSERLGTPRSRVFAVYLGTVVKDLGEERRFRDASSRIKTAPTTLKTGRASGTHYFDEAAMTPSQAKAAKDMGAKAPDDNGKAAPDDKDGDQPPTANPAKKRFRLW